jgi:hypothetical protein
MVASSTVTQKLYTGWPLLLMITKSPSVFRFQLTFIKLSDVQCMYITLHSLHILIINSSELKISSDLVMSKHMLYVITSPRIRSLIFRKPSFGTRKR